MNPFAKRLDTVEEYYFSRKLKEVAQLKAAGHPIINLGIGSPDLPPPPAVVQALITSVAAPTAHKYQSYQGLLALREAISHFYKRNYDVAVNPQNEVLPLMGSKEGIMHISMAFLNEGDGVLVPNPGYPTYQSVSNLLNADLINYNLQEENNWLPDLEELEKLDLSTVKLMWINYPHMPTGAVAGIADLQKIADFAVKHDIILVNDNPYSFILNEKPVSLLQVNGSASHCLELNSLSKSFNMAGWRVGMLLGSSELIQAVLKVKSNMDSGMFYGLQMGAIEALQQSNKWFTDLNTIYKERQQAATQLMKILGARPQLDSVGMFIWGKLADGLESEDVVNDLLLEHHLFIAPGSIFGTQGNGYVRISLCAPVEEINEAINRIKSDVHETM